MRRLSKKVCLTEPKYQCMHCGRTFIDRVPHRCTTGFRKRHLKWIILPEIETKIL